MRACVRAKLRGRVRQGILNAGVKFVEKFSGSGGGFHVGPFAAIRMDFKRKINMGMLYAWTLCGEVPSLCYMHGLEASR